MSTGPGINQSQPGGGNIVFFGNPPYPTTGYLRAGNDAGLILAYRNHANNEDLPGIGLGAQGGSNQDFILFAGILAGEMTSGVGVNPVTGTLRPATQVGIGTGVTLGDTFTPFIQVVAETVSAVSHYDGIHTPTQFIMQFVYDGNGEHSQLSTQDGSLFFNAGGIHTVVELFNVGSFPGRNVLRPYNANTVGLGDAADPWYGLFLAPGDTLIAPMHFDASGVAPAAPSNGQFWFTAAGVFYRAGGVTVGPLIDASSAGGAWAVVSKPADQSTALTALQLDTDLKTGALAAGTRYRIRAHIFVNNAGGGSNGGNAQWAIPAAPTVYIEQLYDQPFGTGGNLHSGNIQVAPQNWQNGNQGEGALEYEIIITPSVAGIVQFQFAETAGGVGLMTVRGGSYLEWAAA